MAYKEHSCVDTDFHKIYYKGNKITQGQAMDKILELAKEILLDKNNDKLRVENSKEICDIWKELLPCMWW